MTISFAPPGGGPRSNQVAYTQPRPEPKAGSLLGSAFRMENDVTNLLAKMNEKEYTANPDFDFVARAKISPLFQNYSDEFIGVGSEEEWQFREIKLAQELKDRAVIHSAGLKGIGAAMLAGVLSPTILLPAGGAATSANVLRGAGKAALWTAFGAGVQEVALHQNQLTRTNLESAVGIGGAAVFGGLLGGAVRYLDPLGMDKIAASMADDIDGPAISSTAPLGATKGSQPLPITSTPVVAQRIDPNNAAFLDTRAGADRFHGSRTAPLTGTLSEGNYSSLNIYGQGFYTSDAVAISSGYNKGGGLYKVNELRSSKVFDMEEAIPEWLLKGLRNEELIESALFDYDIKAPTNVRELYDEIRDASRSLSISADEVQELFQVLNARIEAKGFTVLQHRGGLRTKRAEHTVKIYLNPETDVEVIPVKAADFAPNANKGQPASLSAAKAPPDVRLLDAGVLAPAFGLEKALSGLSPLMRTAQSPIAGLRWMANQMSTGGVMRTENKNGVVTAFGGDIESRVKGWQGKAIASEYEHERLFAEWYKTAKKGSPFRRFFDKGSRQEFNIEVTKALRQQLAGDSHVVPEVNQAARNWQDGIFVPMLEEARAQKVPGFQDVPIDAAMRRVMQSIDNTEVTARWHDFRLIIRENAMEIMRRDKNSAEFKAVMGDAGVEVKGKDLSDLSGADLEDYADQLTEKVYNRLTGTFERHGTIDSMVEVPEKAWRFYYIDPEQIWSNGQKFGDFLEQDMANITRSFVRTLSGDVELMRVFGTVSPSGREGKTLSFWTRVEDEFKEALDGAKTEKERIKLQKMFRQAEHDLEVLEGRLRHRWGQPKDPYAIGFRMGRAALNINTARLMGSVVLSSVADLARPVLKYGLVNTMRHGVLPMMKDFKKFRMTAREAQYAGAALDLRAHGRSTSMFDLFETNGYGNRGERGLQYLTQKTGIVAGFDLWNQEVKMFSANIMMGKMMHDIDRVGAGKATKAQRAFLASVNLDEDTIKYIHRVVNEGEGGTEVSPGIRLPNTEAWDNPEMVKIFRASLVRAVDDTIVTPGIERPSWVDSSTPARMVAQFRSFTFSSTYKVSVAAAQDIRLGNMAQIANGTFLSLALGAFSYYTWATSFGVNSQPYKRMQREFEQALQGDEQAIGRWADEAIGRSGMIGVLQEAIKMGERIPATNNLVTAADLPSSRSPFVDPFLDAFGPSVGLLKNASTVVTTIHDPSSTTFNKGKTLMPYQNVFYLRYIFDRMNDAAMGNFGIKSN